MVDLKVDLKVNPSVTLRVMEASIQIGPPELQRLHSSFLLRIILETH